MAFVVWTWLSFSSAALAAFDLRTLAPPLDPTSSTAQIAAAFALLTWPGFEYAALAAIALWALRHRLRQLAVALVLVIALGWGGVALLKIAFQRPRPEQALDLLTSAGYAYPSGHMVGVVALSIAVGATFAVTRQSVRARILWQVGLGPPGTRGRLRSLGHRRALHFRHRGRSLMGRARCDGRAACAGVKVPIPHELVGEIVRSRAAAEEVHIAPPAGVRRSSSTRPRSPTGSPSGGTWNTS